MKQYSKALSRRSIRLKGYDYSQGGMYFVTICTADRQYLFSRDLANPVDLSNIGRIARNCWIEIPIHFKNVMLDEFVVMPNHVHGIISLINDERKRAEYIQPLQNHPNRNVGVQYIEPSSSPNNYQQMIPKSIGSIIRSYKAAVTRQCRKDDLGRLVWQRNYYEHIIRNENESNCLRKYIVDNPLKWELDRENPASINYNLEYDKYLDLK